VKAFDWKWGVTLGSLGLLGIGCSPQSSTADGKCSVSTFSVGALPTLGSKDLNGNILDLSVGGVAPVTVNGSTIERTMCDSEGGVVNPYPNQPCVQVEICSPSNPTQCQTIKHLLLDTGSFGLRIFSSVITVPLTPIESNGNQLAECVQYGDLSSQWGQVKLAYVRFGRDNTIQPNITPAREPAVAVPIHVVDFNYASPPGPCTASQSYPDTTPQRAQFNGILGVGVFAQDCGSGCAQNISSLYYSCKGNDCSCGAKVALSAQVQNPVAALPVDNNGVILQLPGVASSSTGTTTLNGKLFLGIGTDASGNNLPTVVSNNNPTVFPVSPSRGVFQTRFEPYSPQSIVGFLDSGTNVLIFPAPTTGAMGLLPECTGVANLDGFYCPTTLVSSLSATTVGYLGTPSETIFFKVYNAESLIYNNPGNNVFDSLAAKLSVLTPSEAYFDWGLPFFLGRDVYVGIAGKPISVFGTSGPIWAYLP
jgi:hypothetical protein